VRGTGVDDLFDLRPYALWILGDLIRPESNDTPALLLHHRRSSSIRLNLKRMMVAVDFDHELARYAREVGEVRADGMLTAELGAADAARAQEFPHLAFGLTAVATELSCSLAVVIVSGHDPLT
jgi:hypothetical protein